MKSSGSYDMMLEEFAACARRVGSEDLAKCSSGNLSVRHGDIVLLSATGSWLPDLTEEEVSICRLDDGKVLNGVKPTMESGFHLGIMRARPEVNSVLHFQSPYATVVSCMKDKPENFNVTLEIPMYIGREIPVLPYIQPGTEELASAVVKAMRDHDVAILSNHGQVAAGEDFSSALRKAVFFEMACRIIVLSRGNFTVI